MPLPIHHLELPMRRSIPVAFALSLISGAVLACPSAQLAAAKKEKWTVTGDAQRQQLAQQALACLDSADPVARDELAFEGLQAWMRGDKLDQATLHSLRSALLARLKGPDGEGFGRPFAALVLADVARTDRIKPYLTPAQRAELVDESTRYLAGVRDYRGFDEKEGWRHGVAHGADLMLQLALNPALDKAQLVKLLNAIAAQAVAANAHAYRYGEGERLMAPVFYLGRRDALTEADWDAWFARLVANPPKDISQAALARRHNLNLLLQPLYINLSETKDAALRAKLLPFVTRSLKALD
jgi:hypothetical protein